jgi:hypothetical protein
MDNTFLDALEMARIIADIPFVISSGYRCKNHNKAVGSASRNHIERKAADILCLNSHDRMRIIAGLVQAGFRRIGIYQKHIHCDVMDLQESAWLRI